VNEGITLTRLPYDDSAWHVEVCASGGTYSAAQEFYVYPTDIGDEVRYEIGGRTENWAHYLLLRAFIYDSVGHAALEFAADNRCGVPGHAQARFFICCEVAALNRLGKQLQTWTLDSDEPLNWNPRNA
jgi:hypothetical protein